MRTAIRSSALLAVLALAGGCQPELFSAELDVPDVCFQGISVTFPPTSVVAVASDPLSFSDIASNLPDGLDLQIEVLEVGLRPGEGLDNLDFLSRLGVRMQPIIPTTHSEAMPLLELGDDDHQTDGTMRRVADSPIDVTGFLTASDALFALDIDGELPQTAWKGELDVCVHTNARYAQGF